MSLLMVVEIQCQLCGNLQFAVAGHHLKAVIAGLQQGLDMYPELCKEHITEVPKDAIYVPPASEGKPS